MNENLGTRLPTLQEYKIQIGGKLNLCLILKLNEVVKDLVRKPIEEQPDDLKRLHHIISRRILSL